MRSHFLHMLLYASIVSCFMALVFRNDTRERLKFGVVLWLAMVGGAMVMAWAMYPFPR